MKLVALTSAALLAATTAFAGNPAPFTPEDTPIPTVPAVNDSSLGGSAGWLVPAVAVVLIAAAVVAASNDDED